MFDFSNFSIFGIIIFILFLVFIDLYLVYWISMKLYENIEVMSLYVFWNSGIYIFIYLL